MPAAPKPDPSKREHVLTAAGSPAGWGWFVSGGAYDPYPPHIQAKNRRIVRAVADERRALLEEPPRHGKTEILRYTVGWYIGRRALLRQKPRNVIYAAHTQKLVDRFGGNVRRDLTSTAAEQVFGISVRRDTRAKSDFVTTSGAEFYGVGAGGSPHGRGASLLVTDDLVPNAEAAASDVQMDSIEEFLRSDLLSRREPGFVHIGIQTRWAEMDPHGIMLSLYPDLYDVMRFPAFAEADDDLGREVGEPLWPSMYPREVLEEQQRGMHPYRWAALYQQRPAPQEGGIWKSKWWRDPDRVYDLVPGVDGNDVRVHDGYTVPVANMIRFVVVDTATTTKKTSDFTAILACALTPERPRRLVLLDLDLRRMEGPDVNPSVDRMLKRWGARVAYYETQGNQQLGYQYARRQGIPARSIGTAKDSDVRISGDKVAVAYEAAPLVASGRLLIPRQAAWVSEWEHQMLTFPTGTHDDACDVTAWACHVCDGLRGMVLALDTDATPARRERHLDERAPQPALRRRDVLDDYGLKPPR